MGIGHQGSRAGTQRGIVSMLHAASTAWCVFQAPQSENHWLSFFVRESSCMCLIFQLSGISPQLVTDKCCRVGCGLPQPSSRQRHLAVRVGHPLVLLHRLARAAHEVARGEQALHAHRAAGMDACCADAHLQLCRTRGGQVRADAEAIRQGTAVHQCADAPRASNLPCLAASISSWWW